MKMLGYTCYSLVLLLTWSCRGRINPLAVPDPLQTGCRIDGPVGLAPSNLGLLRIGMPKRDVDRLLGPPVFSPTAGQYYYNTGGDCPLIFEEPPHYAPCGVIADYRVIRYPAEESHEYPVITVTGRLESCRWGAIGE